MNPAMPEDLVTKISQHNQMIRLKLKLVFFERSKKEAVDRDGSIAPTADLK